MNSNQQLDVQTVERLAQVELEEVNFQPSLASFTQAQSERIQARLNRERSKLANGQAWRQFVKIHSDEDYLASLASLKKIEALMDRI